MPILGNTTASDAVQLGVEAIEGVLVPANRKIVDVRITPGWGRTAHSYTPMGYKFPTVNINGKEWATFTVEGALGFGSSVYFLSSGGNYAAPSVSGLAATWLNTPGVSAVNTSKSYSMEWGNASAAFRAVGSHVVGYDIVLNRDEPTFRARMIAERITPGITLTPSPTAVENVPVAGAYIDVFSATTFANLAASPTQLDWVFSYELSVDGLYGLAWPLKTSLPSYGGRFEMTPTGKVKVTALSQVSGGDFTGTPFTLADMRAGALNFLRVRAAGGLILGATGGAGRYVVTKGGTGYGSPPTVAITGDGTGATATATVSGGAVTGVAVGVAGTGYTFMNVAFSGGGGGIGAEAFAVMTPGYLFQVDQGLIMDDAEPALSDIDGLKVVEWPLQLSADPTSNKAVEYTVINGVVGGL